MSDPHRLPEEPHGGVSLALSGGGHRASLFALGALLYLVDAKKNAFVDSIASVSGGSLTNGFIAQTGDFRTASPQEFRDATRPLIRRLAHLGTFQGKLMSKRYKWTLVATLLLTGL